MRRRQLFSITALLLALVVVPLAAGAKGGSERPFTATLTGGVTYDFPGRCGIVTTVIQATGQATHLGRIHVVSSHCPAEPEIVLDGESTLTAANGDKLFTVYDYDERNPANPSTETIVGGTGRFANASGSLAVAWEIVQLFKPGCNPVPDPFPCFDFSRPWPFAATYTGTITY